MVVAVRPQIMPPIANAQSKRLARWLRTKSALNTKAPMKGGQSKIRLTHLAKFAVGLFFGATRKSPSGASIQIIVATTSSAAMIKKITAQRLMQKR